MGKVPARDQERDKALVNDYKAQIYTTAELVGKYKISMTRIYQILNHYGISRIGKVRSNDGKKSEK